MGSIYIITKLQELYLLFSHILNWENSLCYMQKHWNVNGNTFHNKSKYIFMIALKLFLRNHHFKYMTYKHIHINFHVFYWQEFHLCALLKNDSAWGNKTNWLYLRNSNEILAFLSQNLLQFRWIVYNIFTSKYKWLTCTW